MHECDVVRSGKGEVGVCEGGRVRGERHHCAHHGVPHKLILEGQISLCDVCG